jgi:hypothetical protein
MPLRTRNGVSFGSAMSAPSSPADTAVQLIRCHYLYFCTSKASKLSTRSASVEGARRDR